MAALDLRVPFASIQAAFGVDAVVTVPGGDPVETTAVWITPGVDDVPPGFDVQRAERRYILALARDEFPSVPRATLIEAPERQGDTTKRWRVEEADGIDADLAKYRVIPAADEET